MAIGIIDTLTTQWGAIWTALADAGPLANALQIGGVIVPVVGWVRWYIHRRLKDKDGQILDLQDDLADKKKKLDAARVAKGEVEARVATLELQLPRTALMKADAEREQGNHPRADRVLREWVETEGEAVSELLLRRAKWATAHSMGEVRDLGFVVAAAYTTAATVFSPRDESGVALVDDIEALRAAEGQWVPPLRQALECFDDRADGLFDIDRMTEANAAAVEASRLLDRNCYHLALQLVDRALILFIQTAGSKAFVTFRTQRLKSLILGALGRYDEMMLTARAVTDLCEAHPDLGPEHFETLQSRFLVAQALQELGNHDEALRLARGVAEAAEASPLLGPTHPDTLLARFQVAKILTSLGRSEEALPIALALARAFEADSALGPTHLNTIRSQALVANALSRLGLDDKALPIARAVAEAYAANSEPGPAPVEALAGRVLVAQALSHLGRNEEALPIALEVAEAYEANPAIGAAHPFALNSRCVVAEVLSELGRNEEALPIARAVAEAFESSPARGPTHPDTLTIRHLVEQILGRLKRDDGAPSG